MTTKLNSSKNDLSFVFVATATHGIFEVLKVSLDALGKERSTWCQVNLVELAQLHDKYGVETSRTVYAALYRDPHNGFQADLSKHFYTEEEAVNFINTERPRIIREKYDGDEDKFYTDVYAPDYVFKKIGQ